MAEKIAYKAHVILLPLFGHGHINPMIHLSERLAFKGLKVTIAALLSTANSMAAEIESGSSSSITFEPIFDDCDPENGPKGPGGFKGFNSRFESTALQNLTKLITQIQNSEYPVKCLIYDANLPQALDVAKQNGLLAAAFFTQSCAAIAGYYPMQYDVLGQSLPLPAFSMPGLPEIRLPNLPSLGSSSSNHSPILLHILKQFSNIEKADWILFNSFDKLEEQVLQWMLNIWPVRAIGPSISSTDLHNNIDTKEDCLKWLDTKETASVVYVAFGSNAGLSSNQMIEIANSLKRIEKNFLWVVKSIEENGLPRDFVSETYEKGKVVNWCTQSKVLAHKAVGCFVTHCGWNSTLESITFGVPMVAMPQFLDQITNAYFVEEVWGVGVRPKVDNEKGVSSSDDIVKCIRKVTGEEIQRNAVKWKAYANEAFSSKGSSNMHMDDIIGSIS